MIDLNSFLNTLSTVSQSVVKFLFASKWSILIIILIIILYFIWKGLEVAEKKKEIKDNINSNNREELK